MDGRYIPCGFGGRKEINVVNFLSGLITLKLQTTVNITLKKNKVGWKSIRLSVL